MNYSLFSCIALLTLPVIVQAEPISPIGGLERSLSEMELRHQHMTERQWGEFANTGSDQPKKAKAASISKSSVLEGYAVEVSLESGDIEQQFDNLARRLGYRKGVWQLSPFVLDKPKIIYANSREEALAQVLNISGQSGRIAIYRNGVVGAEPS
ncbi:hypothetical protein [Marinobacterium stanieri]|uniref:Toxin co-regulated pilus biosynthesis protein Q n=1 Tax=Marinobacterium stanieri TaxID=49186 RepID=A0A1N6XHS6_9GAMM|nr:hypothetical protein [Marinobacterium stanieri]SIR01827.1 hypothetical protein SAMN05421647_11432 [Marinobacterium stanieri]